MALRHRRLCEIGRFFLPRASFSSSLGPDHRWLNKDEANENYSGIDKGQVILVGLLYDKSSSSGGQPVTVLNNVKYIQQRCPSLYVMGFHAGSMADSSKYQARISQLVVKEYVTFPVFFISKIFSEFPSGSYYVLFKDFTNPVIFHERDPDIEAIENAIADLCNQGVDKPDTPDPAKTAELKQSDFSREPYISRVMQNLLLSSPGCVSVDESQACFFISDNNHHGIIKCDESGRILDCLRLYIPRTITKEESNHFGHGRRKPWVCSNENVESESNVGILMFPWHIIQLKDGALFVVNRRVLKFNRESGNLLNFELSNFGALGLTYWLAAPVERIYVQNNYLRRAKFDHTGEFSLLPGKINIQINVELPADTELVEALQDGSIWRQARGTATEVLESEEAVGTSEKVGMSQQWYDELDNLAFTNPELELVLEEDDDDTAKRSTSDGKARIDCIVNTSPGPSEVVVNATLYLRLLRSLDVAEADEEM